MMLATSTAQLLAFTSIIWQARAWYQTISHGLGLQLHLKTNQHEDERCVPRTSKGEGVLGILNVVGSRQVRALALYHDYLCQRDNPVDYSLFIHFYDDPQAIQLVDLGTPGLEHGWVSYRGIDPDSEDWVARDLGIPQTPRSRKSAEWYEPAESGMTPVGKFYKGLMETVPPGSIRYKIAGTDEYITFHNAVRLVKERNGKLIIPDAGTELTPRQLDDAKEELRYTIRIYFVETGGTATHLTAEQQNEMNERLLEELPERDTSEFSDPRNRYPASNFLSGMDLRSGRPIQPNLLRQNPTPPDLNMNLPARMPQFQPYSPYPFQRSSPSSRNSFVGNSPLLPNMNMMQSPSFDWGSYVYRIRDPPRFNQQLVSEVIQDLIREYERIGGPNPRPPVNSVQSGYVPQNRGDSGMMEEIPNVDYGVIGQEEMVIEPTSPREIGFEGELAEVLANEQAASGTSQSQEGQEFDLNELANNEYFDLLRDIDFGNVPDADVSSMLLDTADADVWPDPNIYIEAHSDVFDESGFFEEEQQERYQ
ncbi:hypothetical protein Dda_8177 [Drechslerella dactyloides]|uniref:Uncharacterized protein n=1 Tax=Drechslerella dactyloides TaxID=74499 RepID=A0AAD6NHZ9_DREDA|nr:hypothetical protein Dda_8177 [Drechslerella dactyloides]